jgi:hypothetical protein
MKIGMNANELRIGNLVNFESLLGAHNGGAICSISAKHVTFKTGTEIPIEALKPIPLTEEWFLRFGFKLLAHKYREIKYGENQFMPKKYWSPVSFSLHSFGCISHFGGIVLPANIQYVHQLQNLYFALTGEELTIK